jgi:hypothetical protein
MEFLAFARTTGDVVILAQSSRLGLAETFESFQALATRDLGDNCSIWNKSLSPPPSYKYLDKQGYFWLNFMQSEVVNVLACKLDHESLSMGRLHIEDSIVCTDGNVIPKSTAFIEWFRVLCKWIRRLPFAHDGAKLSARAEALFRQGVKLSGHSL